MINLMMAVIARAGVVLNARGEWQGFLFWLVSNAWWCGHNIYRGEYVQAGLFGVFWLLSLYGIFKWQYDHRVLEKNHQLQILAERKQEDRRLSNLLDDNVRMRAFIAGMPYQ